MRRLRRSSRNFSENLPKMRRFGSSAEHAQKRLRDVRASDLLAQHAKEKAELIEKPCSNCHGSGRVRKRRKITVKIPMGIDEGNQLRLRGEGEMASDDGEPGDLYVVVHVKPHPQFIREGDDLWHVAIITYPQAALGAEITVPTLEGPTTIKIHPGTQVGEVITLKGKGMPRFRAYGKGDLLVRIGMSVPEKLTLATNAS